MSDKTTLYWDVDTQYDFMEPQGRLYVPDARHIIHNISRLRALALGRKHPLIASTDWHNKTNAEISQQPDCRQTCPEHCVAGSEGAERVGFWGSVSIDYIDSEVRSHEELQALAAKRPLHLVLRKQAIDVFTNPNTRPLLELLHPDKIVVFGVALDICVKHTLEGLQEATDAHLILVEDAVRGLGQISRDVVIKNMRENDVSIRRLNELDKVIAQSHSEIVNLNIQ
ncbi:MAG: cysteine hydrolase [Phycisphaeraceae bacterium]|nr:cysteine hydrolase [Phycisphaeraceae bacterium]